MNSLDILTFKKTIKDYIDSQPLPKEVVRMVVKELLEDISKEALDEAMKEIKEMEDSENGKDIQKVE